MNNLTQTIKNSLVELNVSAHAGDVEETENLFNAGILDSLTLVQFVMLLEEKLNIRVENNMITYDNFQNIKVIEHFINDQLLKKS